MAVNGGPKIPKDGLVLSLDAANYKSFRGEPTTNLLTQPLTFETGYTYESWTTGEIDDNAIIAPDGTQTATRVKRVSGYFYKRNTTSPTFTISPGDTITFSCWVKKLDSSLTGGITIWCYNNTNGPRAWSTEQIYNDRWVRQSVTYTAQTGETSFSFIFSGNYGQMLQGELAIWHPQVEIKSYATPFVNGTRGSTVATGGGWADMTNKGNHGELINGASYDSGSLGALSFDGSNDYIDLDISNSIDQLNGADVTVCAFIKPIAINNARAIFTARGGDSNELYFGVNSNYIHFDRYPPGGGAASSGLSPTVNQWNFIAASATHASNATFCLNGDFVTVPHTEVYNGGTPTKVTIGAQLINGVASRFYTGEMSNIKVFNRALSQNEIKQIYEATRGRYGL